MSYKPRPGSASIPAGESQTSSLPMRTVRRFEISNFKFQITMGCPVNRQAGSPPDGGQASRRSGTVRRLSLAANSEQAGSLSYGRALWWTLLLGVLLGLSAHAAPPFEFTRLIAHWSEYADPGYLSFVAEAKPEIAQVGFYGAHFWSLADTPFGRGYPTHFPVRGHRECAEWFARLNAELHQRGAKVVGHMNVKFLVGDPDSAEGPRGFFRFYREQWDEKVLGPKPLADP